LVGSGLRFERRRGEGAARAAAAAKQERRRVDGGVGDGVGGDSDDDGRTSASRKIHSLDDVLRVPVSEDLLAKVAGDFSGRGVARAIVLFLVLEGGGREGGRMMGWDTGGAQ